MKPNEMFAEWPFVLAGLVMIFWPWLRRHPLEWPLVGRVLGLGVALRLMWQRRSFHIFCALLALCLCASVADAQQAQVIELSPADAARAQAAWEKLKAAEKEFSALRESINKSYLTVPESEPDSGQCLNCLCDTWSCGTEEKDRIYRRGGWDYGFDFSKDFRFIVPQGAPKTQSCWQNSHIMPASYTHVGMSHLIIPAGGLTVRWPATPAVARQVEGMQLPAHTSPESSSAARFVCYEGAGCPPAGSAREQEASRNVGTAKPKPRPFYKDWQFWTARAISTGFAIWDGETTLRCVQQNPICYETNPLLGRRPSRRRLYLVGALAGVGEAAIIGAIWHKSPDYGKSFNAGVAGVRAVLHTVHARENVKNTKVPQ